MSTIFTILNLLLSYTTCDHLKKQFKTKSDQNIHHGPLNRTFSWRWEGVHAPEYP